MLQPRTEVTKVLERKTKKLKYLKLLQVKKSIESKILLKLSKNYEEI